jgi:predicted acetyltransferase
MGRRFYACRVLSDGFGTAHFAAASGLLLEEVRGKGLTYVELTIDPANAASQAVILANGGQLVERFKKTAAHGGKDALRFRIFL